MPVSGLAVQLPEGPGHALPRQTLLHHRGVRDIGGVIEVDELVPADLPEDCDGCSRQQRHDLPIASHFLQSKVLGLKSKVQKPVQGPRSKVQSPRSKAAKQKSEVRGQKSEANHTQHATRNTQHGDSSGPFPHVTHVTYLTHVTFACGLAALCQLWLNRPDVCDSKDHEGGGVSRGE